MSEQIASSSRRVLMVGIATLIMFTVGICYVWSVYQPSVMETYGWDANTASTTYAVMFLAYVVGSIAGGQMQTRLSLRTCLIVGGLFCFVGASWSALQDGSSPIQLYISWGGIVGVGLGIIYNVALAVAQNWLPGKRGLASGIVMAGLSVSSVLFAPLFTWTLSDFGLSATFWLDAAIMLGLALFGAFTLKMPPEGFVSNEKAATEQESTSDPAGQFPPREMIRYPAYYFAVIVRLSACLPHILSAPLLILLGAEKGVDPTALVAFLMLANALNAVGRIVMGALSDRFGRKVVLVFCFAVTFVCCIGLAYTEGLLFPIAYVVLSWCYGGLVAVQPAAVSDAFGLKYLGINWGLVTIGLGIASLLSMLIGTLISSYGLAIETRFLVGAAFTILGIAAIVLERKPPRKNPSLDSADTLS